MTRERALCWVLSAFTLCGAACGGSSDGGADAAGAAAESGGRGGASAGGAGAGGQAQAGTPASLPSAAHTVAGVVSDVAKGTRIAGAEVKVVGSDRSAQTNARGEFSFGDLPEGAVSLSITKDGYAPGYAVAESAADAQASLVSLKKLGQMQGYDPTRAATLVEKTDNGPYAVIFTPDSLDTSDTQLKVAVTPLDPTREDAALPGDLIAGGSSPNALDAVTFAEFSIVDSSGKKVNLKADKSAIVELPIPLTLRADYPLDSKIHCYAYNPQTGKWEDFVEGTVTLSSVDKVTPVLRASIRHFSWYGGAPAIMDQKCVLVQVVSKLTGKPLEGATVSARPGLKATTGKDGLATITVKKDANIKYTATKTYTDTYVDDKGNLIPQQGSKVIEIGRVEEDQDLVVPVLGPCKSSTPASADSSKAVRIETGALPNGAFAYEVTAVVQNGSTSVTVEKGIADESGSPEDPEPVDDAKITLVSGDGKTVQLMSLLSTLPPGAIMPGMGLGLYTTPSGQMLAANGGERYTLEVDVDGNGSVDASASCTVPGKLAWIKPEDGASYDSAGFMASWSDTASSGNVQYFAVLYNQDSSAAAPGAVYSGTALSFTPDPPLAAGSYQANLQSLASSVDFAGVSVQGQLVCGAIAAVEVQFSIR
jgi:hypothetical protein